MHPCWCTNYHHGILAHHMEVNRKWEVPQSPFPHPDASVDQYTMFVMSIWQDWSCVHRILCWIEIGLKLVEKDHGFEFLFLQHWWSVHKHRKFSNPDPSFVQYMFVLRISTFAMTALISCTSNTMLDRIGFKLVEEDVFEFLLPQYWYQSTSTEHLHILMPPFDEYIFVQRISTLDMSALISCASNTMLNRNQP